MMIRSFNEKAFVLAVLILVLEGGCFPAFSGNAPPLKAKLVIGKIAGNPKRVYKQLKPMVDYAASHMADLGIQGAEVLIAADITQMCGYFKHGKVDWITETPSAALLIHERSGGEIFLRKWKKGVPEYHTVFFVRRDSGIQTLSDLKGKTIAFEDPGSTSAYFIPVSILIREGLNLVRLYSIQEKPQVDRVGYLFSRQEINSFAWVHKGRVSAAAFSNLDWDKEDHMWLVSRREMKIIHRSRPYPRALEVVRKDLNPLIKARLKSVLLGAGQDPGATEALGAYHSTKKFDELNGDTWESLEELRKVQDLVLSRVD